MYIVVSCRINAPAVFLDYGDLNIWFFSEAQIIVKTVKLKFTNRGGTFKRTGDDEKMLGIRKQLSEDKKENSEHYAGRFG
jgi:hypothetical protein